MANSSFDSAGYRVVRVTPDSPLFKQAVELTDKYYGVDNEKESIRNFQDHIAHNDATHQEGWIALVDRNGKLAAATNFAAYVGDPAKTNNTGMKGSLVDIYTPIDSSVPPAQQDALLNTLVAARNVAAQDFVGAATQTIKPSLYSFVEQNNPALMTAASFDEEAHRRGNNEWKAMQSNAKLGLVPLDMRYIQPSLGAGQSAVANLTLMAGIVEGDGKISPLPPEGIPIEATKDFVKNYFENSFPKGTTLDSPGLDRMRQSLNGKGDHVGIVSMKGYDDLAQTVTPSAVHDYLKQHPHAGKMALGDIYASRTNQALEWDEVAKHKDILPYAAQHGAAMRAAKAVSTHGAAVVPDHEAPSPLPPAALIAGAFQGKAPAAR